MTHALFNISCNIPVSHITADAHSPMRLVCTLEWSHSDHILHIERGRYTKPRTPVNERLCTLCNCVEDELHFVTACTINQTERKIMYDKICLKFPNFSQLNDAEKFMFLFTFSDAQTLSWLGKYLYKSFLVRVSACSSAVSACSSAVPCAAMHLPVALSFFISPVNPCFKPIFLLFLTTYLKQWYEFYILCVFLRLPAFNCHTYSAFHGVYTESGCLRFVLNILCVSKC